MNKKKTLYLNGIRYKEEDKCPACSSERDTGGRLQLHKRTNYFLKCRKCKYSVKSERTINQQLGYLKKKQDKQLGLKWPTQRNMKISTKNIDKVIECIRVELDGGVTQNNPHFWMNLNKRVLNRNRYKGAGRPRISDYDIVRDTELVAALNEVGLSTTSPPDSSN